MSRLTTRVRRLDRLEVNQAPTVLVKIFPGLILYMGINIQWVA